MDAILKFQTTSKKKKIERILRNVKFFQQNVYETQSNLRSIFNILQQQNHFFK